LRIVKVTETLPKIVFVTEDCDDVPF
jgi:hypothetical protein